MAWSSQPKESCQWSQQELWTQGAQLPSHTTALQPAERGSSGHHYYQLEEDEATVQEVQEAAREVDSHQVEDQGMDQSCRIIHQFARMA